MSYSVLLVDDDQRIRMGLAKHINWGRLGYNSPILAADVSQARQALLANRVDILVTDIRLPDESGLEFCRQVRSMYPDMPIFILSAFSDFEYAREAIRFGVKHYFTKPTDLQAFSSAMASTRDELDQKRRTRERQSALEKRYSRAYRFLLSHLWADLARGVIREDDSLHAFFEENHIVLPYPCFSLMKLQAPPNIMHAEQSLLRDSLEDAGCIVHHFSRTENSVCFLLNVPDETSVENALKDFTPKAAPEIQLCISSFVPSLSQLPKCMTQLQRAAEASGQIRRYSPSSSESASDGFSSESGLERELLDAVSTNDEKKAKETLEQLYRLYVHLSPDARCDIFVQLLARLQQYTRRFGVTLSSLYGSDFSASRTAQQLLSPLQMDLWLQEHIRRLLSLLHQSHDSYSTHIINEIRKYISAHFSEDITLSSVAQAVHLSPYYVSKMFKKVTGEKFIDYLTSVRMEKAMELLSSCDSRIYEVAERVGYKSTKHFSQVFRTYTGKTPFEYKKSACGNDEA